MKLGVIPTRRNIFSASDALRYAKLIHEKLVELKIDFVDIFDINEEGLLFDDSHVDLIVEKFRQEQVGGLFFPHCNFGTEYLCARIAKKMNLPILLWGPRDEAPDSNGIRLRDSQCGLFATGKVFRRFNVKFTYLINCRLNDEEFCNGIHNFISICNVVNRFRNIRILQIGPRPFDFWSTMCNEGELLEKFNIQLAPIPLVELVEEINKVKDNTECLETLEYCVNNYCVKIDENALKNVSALKVAMKNLATKYGANAIAIQCWNALQREIGIMPCAANSLLNEEGIPVVCETDIHGAITALLVEAASINNKRSFFADWTVRHPSNDNAELLQHCGPWPKSVLKEKPTLGYPLAFNYPGAVEGLAKEGNMTICRFDGDNGEYSLLLGNAKAIDGPYTKGTYVWIEVDNLARLENKIVTGPYIHHCVGIYEDVVPILYEACKYIGINPDLYDPIEEQIKEAIYWPRKQRN